MKNFEKWEKEILDILKTSTAFAAVGDKPVNCNDVPCIKCDFSYPQTKGEVPCSVKRTKWLYEECIDRPKLTKHERKFCELFEGKGYYIARDKDDDLFGYTSKPIKNAISQWVGNNYGKEDWFNINGVLKYADIKFDFIKWEDKEPWSIDDLLNLDVIDK